VINPRGVSSCGENQMSVQGTKEDFEDYCMFVCAQFVSKIAKELNAPNLDKATYIRKLKATFKEIMVESGAANKLVWKQ
jgi:hypothetical protein